MQYAIPKGWWLALGGTLVIAVLALLPPFVTEEVRGVIMAGFSTVCHQIPSRSPHIGGVSLAVCHRCMGIYLALGAASVSYLALRRWDGFIRRNAALIITLSLVPLGIDWFVDVAGWWTNTPFSRFVTGSLFGIAAGIYFTRAMIELLDKKELMSESASDDVPAHDIQVRTFH